MARFYYESAPELSEISLADKLLRDKIVAIIDERTQEMENYSYYGSNPGVPVDSYEDIAEEIMLTFGLTG